MEDVVKSEKNGGGRMLTLLFILSVRFFKLVRTIVVVDF